MRPRASARRDVRNQSSRAGGSRSNNRAAGSLKRREFLGLVGAASLATALGRTANAAPRRDKPNLLVIWTDQERKDVLRVYGNRKLRADNLNKLADESFVITDPYICQPICTPSRSSIMTGLWPHQNGCVFNSVPLPQNIPCLPELLGDADYRTGYMGKWHLGDEIYPQHGFLEWQAIEDGYRSSYGKNRSRDDRSQYHHWLIEHGINPEDNNEFVREKTAALPIELSKAKFLQTKAIEFLRRHKDEPFILYVNFLEPHPPYTGPYNDMYDPKDVDLPPNFSSPLGDEDPVSYRRWQAFNILKRSKDFDFTQESGWRKLIAHYWGLMSEVDQCMGEILSALESLGLADNTVVVHTSDHGDMMGSHRTIAKQVMYQEAVQVPWLMRIPKLGRKQRLMRGPTSHIDLVPTLLDLLGKPAGERLPGRSLVPWFQGGPKSEDHAFIEWNVLPKATTQPDKKLDEKDDGPQIISRAVVTPDGWKLCLNIGDKSQLFNLNEDPYETRNLYSSGKHDDVIARLRDKIHAWQKTVRDTAAV